MAEYVTEPYPDDSNDYSHHEKPPDGDTMFNNTEEAFEDDPNTTVYPNWDKALEDKEIREIVGN